MPRNCQLSHNSDRITSGSAKRPMNFRTSVTIEPVSRPISSRPKAIVTSASGSATPARWPIASTPSRMTTISKVVQPISCTMFSSTGRRAKLLP